MGAILEVNVQIPIFVEPRKGGGFVVRGTSPIELSATGETVDAALTALERLVHERLGKFVLRIGLDRAAIPPMLQLLPLHTFDDTLRDEWRAAVEEYRHQVDESPDFPWIESAAAP